VVGDSVVAIPIASKRRARSDGESGTAEYLTTDNPRCR
jgi:hypothetical protein